MKIISPEIVSYYFQCKRKAFLAKSSKGGYKKTDFELMVGKYASHSKEAFYSDKGIQPVYTDVLDNGDDFIANINIQAYEYQLKCDLLQKKIGKSSLGNYFYEPIVFIGQNIVHKHDRIKLTAIGFILEKFQGKYPNKGIIIKSDGTQKRISIENSYREIENSIIEIKNFKNIEQAIFLNKNCITCAFEKECKKQAIKDDNLSLLNKFTQKRIKQLERKGIFTIKQLSYLYKPRRRKKKNSISNNIFKPEIQALAIRTKKTYLKELPKINMEENYFVLDIESVPDNKFHYLFGILKIYKGKSEYHFFWSDTEKDELSSWKKAIELLSTNNEVSIFHYGNYELQVFEKLALKYSIAIQEISKRLVNVNTFIYGKIYFPTLSNRLKDLAEILGFKWRIKNSSGINSIVWRFYWDQGRDEYRQKLLTYNEDDCLALQYLIHELYRIRKEAEKLDHIDFIDKIKDNSTEAAKKLRRHFEIALELAHHKYDNKKIKVNFEKNTIKKLPKDTKKKNKYSWLNKNLKKPDKLIFFPPDKYCFTHKERILNKSKLKSKRVKLDLVFTKNGIRKTVIEYMGQQAYCPICNNSYASLKFRKIDRCLYGHNLMAWVVFQRVEIQLSFSKISSSLNGLINEKIRPATGVDFIQRFSEYHKVTENKIILGLLESSFIHADETTVSILGETQYVWVFSSNNYVYLKLTKQRDISFFKELLKGYSGVLISDFFAGYDSVDCVQQKCWVHLIRDLNNDLWKNPFDKEFEIFANCIRNLILPIFETGYKFGLKKYHFRKHKKSVQKFYIETIDKVIYKSEICNRYQKRFKRYRKNLFTFIDFDGINWHNNIAENRIRHICVQRKISGSFGPVQFPHYLRMLSIMQSCNLQNKSFLGFLLSKEKDVEKFVSSKRRFDIVD